MKTYFYAYAERLEAYNIQFLKLAEDLKEKGYKVYTHNKTGLIKSIKVLDENNNGVRVQFNDVPYRFTFEYDIKPSKETGSGFHGNEYFVNDLDFPFTIEEIIENFKPMYIDSRFFSYQKEL